MVSPVGVALARDGSVYTSEAYYRLVDLRWIRGSQTQVQAQREVSAPSITPNSGYYPMGQFVQVSSANQDVYYTVNGSEPDTNSLKLGMNGNVGVDPAVQLDE